MCDWLSEFIDDNGVYMFMVLVWACFAAIAWLLFRKRKSPPPVPASAQTRAIVGIMLASPGMSSDADGGRSLLPHERTSMNATGTIERQTLDVKSSATELGVCEETVRRLVRRKVLRKLPGLRRVLIPRTELDRYLNSGNHARLS